MDVTNIPLPHEVLDWIYISCIIRSMWGHPVVWPSA